MPSTILKLLDKIDTLEKVELNESEKIEPVKNFDRFEKQKHSTVLPKAFTEKGFYIFFFGRDESRPYRI